MLDKIAPYKDSELSKQDQVEKMFDKIAHKYDYLNHLFSLGIDKRWRKKAINILKNYPSDYILDVATGTADFAICSAIFLKPKSVIGLDLSESMLNQGRKKIVNKKLKHIITLQKGNGSDLTFESERFNIVTIAFGIRNFEYPKKGLQEIFRVLNKDGVLCVLEFSNSNKSLNKTFFGFYFKKIMPFLGKIISKDKYAYNYLNRSVEKFPNCSKFKKILLDTGFISVDVYALFFDMVYIYIAHKSSRENA